MPASPYRVLDEDHLHHQTHGDGDLERELLQLFEAQCLTLVPLIIAPGPVGGRAEASHALKGGALAVGAEQIARLSGTLETAFQDDASDEALLPMLEDLRTAAVELAGEIARWRRRAASRQG